MRGMGFMSDRWAASVLDWWAEAGVDTLVAEEPRDWLAAAKAPDAPPAPRQAALPSDLDSFRQWLMTGADVPYATPGVARVAPSGDPAGGLMVMVDMPSAEDVAAGTLISGEAGALFDRMLVATGQSRERIYLASLSPIRTPTGGIDQKHAARLTEIARHHIALAKPRALLLFGDISGKALVGSAVAGARARWHDVPTPAGAIRTLVTIRPEKLVAQPGLKKLAWADLQMLIEELKP
jgi:uracil-DNA glycosylase family 4